MKVNSFTGSQIVTEFAAPGLWRLKEQANVLVWLEGEGVLRYEMAPGFLTDMRSGSHAIDGIIPKFTGCNKYNLAILAHDFNYTRLHDGSHAVCKEMADELLRQMAVLSGQIGAFKAGLMKTAVRLFGGSAYYSENGEREIECAKYMKFRWEDK